jgi:plasmid maintenance system killer protein
MIVHTTDRFKKSYVPAPRAVQKACEKQLLFLMNDLRHPSLHAKKYDEVNNVWQARINDDWRLYFTILHDTYILIGMTPHPK